MNPILALDFGRARIGVAISDELQLLAHPLETIPANQQPASRVAQIVREKKVDHVVAGIPKRMNGQIGSAGTEGLAFVRNLQESLPGPGGKWDAPLKTWGRESATANRGKKNAATARLVEQVCAENDFARQLDKRR